MEPRPDGGAARRGHGLRLNRSSGRLAGFRFFSSERHATRKRRPTDLILLILGLGGVGVASIWRDGTRFSEASSAAIEAIPGLFGWFWELVVDLGVMWALALVLAAAFTKRFGLVRDQVLALGAALAAGAMLADDLDGVRTSLFAAGPPAVFPAVRLAIVAAVVVTTSPHVGLPFRRVGRWLLVLGAGATIVVGAATPLGVLAGLALGAVGAAVVHLALGSPGGVPTIEQVALGLADLGVAAVDLRPAELEPRGVALVRGSSADGTPLTVKVYGRDARDGQFFIAVWGRLWYRDDTSRLAISRRQQVEREGFVTLLAERAGVPVAPVVAAGVATGGDALVVVEVEGTPLSAMAPASIGDDVLRAAWEALDRLHDAGVAHGRLGGDHLLVHDGSVGIADFAAADVTTAPFLLLADEAQLLVASALAVGSDRAVAAAVEAIGPERLGAVIPYLQPPVLAIATRRQLRTSSVDLDDLAGQAAEAAGIEVPKLEQVRRVTWGSLLTAGLLLFGGYVLVAGIAGLGVDQILDELEQASSGWIMAGFVAAPLVQVGQAFSALGASPKALRFGPMLLLQFSIQFLALAVPSAASRIALNIRFFRGAGLTPTEAVAVGAVDSFAGFVIEASIVVLVLLSGAASLELGIEDPIGGLSPRALAIALLAIAVVVLGAIAVPKVRSFVRAKVVEASSVLRSLRDPTKLALLVGGNLGSRIALAAVLSFSLQAFGFRLPLAELLLVNTIVSLFAGILPIPGGIGVTEAATTAGLVAFGIPETTALATAIVFRLVTFYLPPIWGAVATKRLRQQGFI